jgi:hypothetical protein
MMIKENTLCRCGHWASDHTYGVFPSHSKGVELERVQSNPTANGCAECRRRNKECKIFQLTNLDFIEYLAEKRGLLA